LSRFLNTNSSLFVNNGNVTFLSAAKLLGANTYLNEPFESLILGVVKDIFSAFPDTVKSPPTATVPSDTTARVPLDD
jgi:hypothetical protein